MGMYNQCFFLVRYDRAPIIGPMYSRMYSSGPVIFIRKEVYVRVNE